MNRQHELEPRVSVLEEGQKALSADVLALSQTVKEQGAQLTNAISRLADNQYTSSRELIDKVNNLSKTDWQTIIAAIGVVILLIGAISTPIWMNFTYIDKTVTDKDARISKLEDKITECMIQDAIIKTKIEYATNKGVSR